MKTKTRRSPARFLGCAFGLCCVIFLAAPAAAKVAGCDPLGDRTTCTEAQMTASLLKTAVLVDTAVERSIVDEYVAYLDLILLGYTPNDQELQDAITLLNLAVAEYQAVQATLGQPADNWQYHQLDFKPSDVFEDFGDDLNKEFFLSVRSDGTWHVQFYGDDFEWPIKQFTAAVRLEDCEEPVCNRSTDRIVAMLGGGFSASRDSQYVDSGFRVTGIGNLDGEDLAHVDAHSELWSFESFGLWAQDSYWGAVWDDQYIEGIDFVSEALFIAGGRNPAKPTASGTWKGLAMGARRTDQSSDSQIRVGHSEITVHLDRNEVDVTITGISGGSSATVRVGNGSDELATVTVTALSALEWKGLSLTDQGHFQDQRRSGVVPMLDDVLGSSLPPEGEVFSQTHFTIGGQFYGTDGVEVTGVFDKAGYVGSFGAYQEEAN